MCPRLAPALEPFGARARDSLAIGAVRPEDHIACRHCGFLALWDAALCRVHAGHLRLTPKGLATAATGALVAGLYAQITICGGRPRKRDATRCTLVARLI